MAMEKEADYLIKIILVGDSGVGKSCIVQRFTENKFSTNQMYTIGVDFQIRTIDIDGKVVKMQIWDTAGQEKFQSITSQYYRGAHGIIVVYDITRRETFDHAPKWFGEIERHAMPDARKLLIGNKSDLNDQRQIESDEAQSYGRKMNITAIETSAKEATNVDHSFKMLAQDVIQNLRNRDISQSNPTTKTPHAGGRTEVMKLKSGKQKGSCC